MKNRKLTRLWAIVILAFSVHAATAGAAEFSADMTIPTKGKKKAVNFKIYVKDGKMRQEKTLGKRTQNVIIFRPDKKVIWNIMPKQKMYMDYTYNSAEKPITEWTSEDEKKARLVGSEDLNGFACKKYEYVAGKGRNKTVTIWIAEELNFPIKSTGGEREYELTNIQVGEVSGSMFEIPKGFQNWN